MSILPFSLPSVPLPKFPLSSFAKYTPPLHEGLGLGFETLARNNNPPSATERQTLEARIKEVQKEIERLRLRINASLGQDDLVRGLTEQKAILTASLEKHDKILAPIRKITCHRDILKVIFSYLPRDRDSFHHTWEVLSILRVCKDWFLVTVLATELWSTLNIRYQDLFHPRCDARVRKHLVRAGRRPLTICIIQHDISPQNLLVDPWTALPAFQTLMQVADRWYDVDIPITCNSEPALHHIGTKLKNLRYLTMGPQVEVVPEEGEAPWAPTGTLEVFRHCSNLRELTIHHHIPLSHVRLPTDPRNSTHFRGPGHPLRVFKSRERISKRSLAKLLCEFPNLEQVVVDFSLLKYGPDVEGRMVTPISHKHLTSLTLKQMENLGPDNRTTLCSLNDLPNLKHLQIPLSQEHSGPLAAFVSKQAKNLQSLQFRVFPGMTKDGPDLTPQTVFNIICRAPNITKLIIDERWGGVPFLPPLINMLSNSYLPAGPRQKVQNSKPFPLLEDIHLSSSTPESHRALFNFVKSRLKGFSTSTSNSNNNRNRKRGGSGGDGGGATRKSLVKLKKVAIQLQENADSTMQAHLYHNLLRLRDERGLETRLVLEGVDPVSKEDVDWDLISGSMRRL